MSGVTVTAGGSGYYETPTLAFSGGGGSSAAATISSELRSNGGNAKTRYISRRVTLKDGFDAQDLKVFMNAYKPKDTDIKVYFRVHNAEDPEDFEDKPYVLFTQETDANLISQTRVISKSMCLGLANNISYTSNSNLRFIKTLIKIVLEQHQLL